MDPFAPPTSGSSTLAGWNGEPVPPPTPTTDWDSAPCIGNGGPAPFLEYPDFSTVGHAGNDAVYPGALGQYVDDGPWLSEAPLHGDAIADRNALHPQPLYPASSVIPAENHEGTHFATLGGYSYFVY